MREFNYRRAHREWAQPQFDKLSIPVKMLWQRVVAATASLRQVEDLSVRWPADNPGLQEAFTDIPVEELAAAMFVIYRWGHWAHVHAITAKPLHSAPRTFVGGDFDVFTPGRSVNEWLAELANGDDSFDEDAVERIFHYAGPNNIETVGAYWKFESLAKASMISRRHEWGDGALAVELGYIQDSFMDHKPGTDYSNDEKHLLFTELFADHFDPVEVITCNYRPHPFMIGLQHVACASETGGLLDHDAMSRYPCAHVGCGQSLADHTFDTVLMLRPLRSMEHEDAGALLLFAKPLFMRHNIDGVALLKSEFTISEPMWMCTVRCHTDVPRDDWDHADQLDNPVGSYNFTPRAKNEDAAREAALDQFHSTVPIFGLEMFQVDVEVMPREMATEPAQADV